MFHIKSVEIKGFWGKYSIKTDFYSEVNIFIGKNGTGKTTFMNLLQATLQVDFTFLVSIEFQSIIIRLTDNLKTRTIKVERQESLEVPYEKIIFKVGTKSYDFQVFEGDVNFRKGFMRRPKLAEQYELLRSEISELVKISSLSVHRTADISPEIDEYSRRQTHLSKPAIDQRLEQLMQKLTSYQLSLERKAREQSSIFEKSVLMSMLYDQEFDRWDLDDVSNVELSKEKADLKKAYKELGVLDDIVSKKIDAHIKALSSSLKRIKNSKSGIVIEDIFPMSLLRRTRHIIDLTKETEEKKQEIFQPIMKYIDIIRSFAEDKELKFNISGELQVYKEGKLIPLPQLSSGEKQLFILLTETLLQKNEPFIFLADEPELSLHIEWQAMIISSIIKLNQNAQVIIATHSPEIAGGWGKDIIDMEDILNG